MNRKNCSERLAPTTAALLQPRLNRSQRKGLMTLRARIFTATVPEAHVIPRTEPIAAPVKFARKLTSLKLTQLFQQQRKFAREASKAKHLLAKMSGFSRVRTQVAAAQDLAIAALKQVTAEIKARKLACEGKLAEVK